MAPVLIVNDILRLGITNLQPLLRNAAGMDLFVLYLRFCEQHRNLHRNYNKFCKRIKQILAKDEGMEKWRNGEMASSNKSRVDCIVERAKPHLTN